MLSAHPGEANATSNISKARIVLGISKSLQLRGPLTSKTSPPWPSGAVAIRHGGAKGGWGEMHCGILKLEK